MEEAEKCGLNHLPKSEHIAIVERREDLRIRKIRFVRGKCASEVFDRDR